MTITSCFIGVLLLLLIDKSSGLTCRCGTQAIGALQPSLSSLASAINCQSGPNDHSCVAQNGQTCVKIGLTYMNGTMWMFNCAVIQTLVSDGTMQLFWPGLQITQVPVCGTSSSINVGTFSANAGSSQLCQCATDNCNNASVKSAPLIHSAILVFAVVMVLITRY